MPGAGGAGEEDVMHQARVVWSSILRALAAAVAAAVALLGCPERPKTDPGLVQVATAVDRPEIQAGRAGEVVLQVKVEALQPPRAARPPLNLAVVIDTSGSMEGDPIDDAKNAVADLMGRLHGGDRVVLVGFGSVATVLGRGVWEGDRPPAALDEAVQKIQAGGTTDMRAGLTAALTETADWRDANHLSRIILLSDGKPNDPLGLVEMATQAGSEGMPVIAFGLGIEFDEALLGEMARTSNGTYAFLSGSEQIGQRFQDEILKLETLVARSVSLEIVPGPGIDILEIPGWDDLSPGREAVIALGDLVGGRQREVLLRLGHGERSHEARVELADVTIRYLDVYGGSGTHEKTFYVGIRSNEDAAAVDAAKNKEVTDHLASVRAHLTAIRAAEDMRRGDVAAAGQTLLAGMEAYRGLVSETDEAALEQREEYGRLRRLQSAVDQADAVIAARAREEAERQLDQAGVGAVTVPGGGEGGPPRTSGGPGGSTTTATEYYDRSAAMPAAAPPEPYEWSAEESEQILEVHSGAYGDMYGD
jgi:Ca-activated chloride channel family protein